MRPVSITIEGLRSFRQPVTVDFARRELVAIIGDTGAGKSSILEALTWALYGNATWTKQAAPLVGDGSPQMRVRLEFEADGNRWRVTRAIKRRQDGTPGAASAELVCLDGDRPAADGVRQVGPAIERLLGLDWDAFTRTVVLPQGQFARLLTEGDVDRLQTLRQIWRTDELGAARSRTDEVLRELQARLEYLRGRREHHPADVQGALAEARAAAAAAERASAAIDGVVEEANHRGRAGQEADRRARVLRQAIDRVDEALAGEPVAEAARLAETAATIERQQAELDGRVADQEQRMAGLEQPGGDAGPGREETERAVGTLDALATSLGDLAEHARRCRGLHDRAAHQREEVNRLAQHAERGEQHERRAEQEVGRWQRVDAAATAAHGLHSGDDCPVCARALPEGFTPPAATGLASAQRALAEARTAARQARDRHRTTHAEAAGAAQQAAEETERLAGRLERVAQAVARLPEPFRPVLPEPFTVEAVTPGELDEALVAGARAAATERKRRLDARDEALRRAREELSGLRARRSDLRDRLHDEVVVPATRLRAQLERICERIDGCAEAGVELAQAVPPLGEALDRLAGDAEAVAGAAAAALGAARAAAERAEQRVRDERQALALLLEQAGAGSLEALAERQVTLRADARRAGAEVERLERAVEEVATLDAHLARGGEAAGALTDLRTLLQDGHFVRWLTLRRSRALLAVASSLLQEMTGGRYAFADITDEHDEWRVFDHETGFARSPRTLSGGESFVASLALALAMVEMVARSGGRLDALFLDEGFGALDRDNLDAAITALESSATRGRMVAVISHVQAVAERLTDVLAVERAPSGSRARWLTAAEREGLAEADAGASLGNLIG